MWREAGNFDICCKHNQHIPKENGDQCFLSTTKRYKDSNIVRQWQNFLRRRVEIHHHSFIWWHGGRDCVKSSTVGARHKDFMVDHKERNMIGNMR